MCTLGRFCDCTHFDTIYLLWIAEIIQAETTTTTTTKNIYTHVNFFNILLFYRYSKNGHDQRRMKENLQHQKENSPKRYNMIKDQSKITTF